MSFQAHAGVVRAGLLSVGLILAPSLVWAQAKTPPSEVVATAHPGAGAPTAAPRAATGDVDEDEDDRDDADDKMPLPDHKIHGAVSVGVGTGGYREVAGEVTAPIGDTGQATLAIDTGQINGRRR
jgi:hypothetical protein